MTVTAKMRVRGEEGRGEGGGRPRGQLMRLLHAVGRLERLRRGVAATEDFVLFAQLRHEERGARTVERVRRGCEEGAERVRRGCGEGAARARRAHAGLFQSVQIGSRACRDSAERAQTWAERLRRSSRPRRRQRDIGSRTPDETPARGLYRSGFAGRHPAVAPRRANPWASSRPA